jgi:alginate O-acetyltransferase complex protein AlgI
MLFNSLSYVYLVLITMIVYYLPIFRKLQVPMLIVASLVFYAYSQPVLLILLTTSIVINIFTSYYVVYGNQKLRKTYATLGVVTNLGVLAFFKYSPLIAKTLFMPTDSVAEFLLAIPLPIGISFYTFQGISLMIDVFKSDKVKEYKNLVPPSLLTHASQTMFFIVFFPQLVAGPVVKAHDFIPQIKSKYFQDIDWESCFKALIIGYFLKMVVADNIKEQTVYMSFPYYEGQPTLVLVMMLFGYSMQIFADFAGYSLIAIGTAHLFGYTLMKNFDFPYISSSFSEFWRRWHISLSTFLKEYLYIPLGGNRHGELRTYFNLLMTMFLGGLWHGAAWSYAVWGMFHGGALAVERFLKNYIKLPDTKVISFFQTTFVFLSVTLFWLLFRLPEFSQAIDYVMYMFKNTSIGMIDQQKAIVGTIALYSVPVWAYHWYYLHREKLLFIKKYEYIAYGILLFFILTNSGTAGDFIYFQF